MRRLVIFALAVAGAAAALANDTTASTAAGGLVLERTDDIDMVSEDLFVSATAIRVNYVFRNQSPGDVETIVAFPMPPRDLSQEWGQDIAYPSDFKTTVEGQPVESTLERKAVVKGRDYTSLLNRLGIPIDPDNIMDATKAMDRLTEAQKAQLQSLGLAGDEEFSFGPEPMAHHLIPLWTVQDRYWWKQRFPAGRDLHVEHRYVPGAGGSVGTLLGSEYVKPDDPDLLAMIARYCIDRDFLAAVNRLRKPDQDIPPVWIDYILTTGANWRSPIGTFRLVVDKDNPANLVSFCADGVKKISPTQFEVVHRDWRPTSDLHVLIIEPPPSR
ncbi:MAG TPA: DUF4424 family protein [Sphingomicrobium sp.]|nr:DUF4424 family protein [Sphingomicrobium sp.]